MDDDEIARWWRGIFAVAIPAAALTAFSLMLAELLR
jgi:hypothetical protein